MSTSEEENKTHYRRTFEEVFNQGNLALVDDLVAPDYLNHEVPPGTNNRGPESTRPGIDAAGRQDAAYSLS